MSLIPDVVSILDKAGYRTVRVAGIPSAVAFEDEVLFGVVVDYESVDALKRGWKEIEQNFLTLHAPSLRRSDQKAWNCYSVHITAEPCPKQEMASLLSIEEDFRGTRKIARATISTRKDLAYALAPLLPLQNAAPGERQGELPDFKQRFRGWSPAAVDGLLAGVTIEELITLLLGGS